ncbi:MAG: hypothetical protein FD167_3780, partial [bacterium]
MSNRFDPYQYQFDPLSSFLRSKVV